MSEHWRFIVWLLACAYVIGPRVYAHIQIRKDRNNKEKS